MDQQQIIHQLAANAAVFRSLLEGVSEAQYRWKPAPEKWCLLEVICHLCDEEREDFRARVGHVLEHPDAPMPPIDPVGWVQQRAYREQDYEQKLREFLAERRASVQWLQQLEVPAWDNVYQHPRFGAMSAFFFLRNWLAHDYLHFRQITRLKYQYLEAHSDDPLDYAGGW